MRSDLMGDVGLVLAGFGGALQWARAQRGFPEWAFYVVGLAVTVGVWAIAVDWGSIHDPQAFALHSWTIVATLYGTLLGGNKVASGAASGIATLKPGAEDHPMVPVTDSK
jgi:hypothetical protein